MYLYHYTDVKIKDKIKVKYFGSNIYTFNDYKISNIKRAFYFTGKTIPEYRFKNCRYRYIINIKRGKIYNLKRDKRGYKRRYKDIDKLLWAIKRQYKGVLYNVGYDIVCLFEDTKIKKEANLKW